MVPAVPQPWQPVETDRGRREHAERREPRAGALDMASLVDELDTRHVDIGIFPALHVFKRKGK
ncbi:hypothetical protein D3C86_2067260 [compost metagenome]